MRIKVLLLSFFVATMLSAKASLDINDCDELILNQAYQSFSGVLIYQNEISEAKFYKSVYFYPYSQLGGTKTYPLNDGLEGICVTGRNLFVKYAKELAVSEQDKLAVQDAYKTRLPLDMSKANFYKTLSGANVFDIEEAKLLREIELVTDYHYYTDWSNLPSAMQDDPEYIGVNIKYKCDEGTKSCVKVTLN